jgi:hypothetical protein
MGVGARSRSGAFPEIRHQRPGSIAVAHSGAPENSFAGVLIERGYGKLAMPAIEHCYISAKNILILNDERR